MQITFELKRENHADTTFTLTSPVTEYISSYISWEGHWEGHSITYADSMLKPESDHEETVKEIQNKGHCTKQQN